MQSPVKTCVSALLIVTSFAANAQKPATWIKEPSAVFGIVLGEVLDNAAIGECGGAKPILEGPAGPLTVCSMARPSFGNLEIAGFPVPVFERGFVARDDGVVTSILLQGGHDDYPSIKALLQERYGRPSAVRVETLQNAMGAAFKSESSVWVGKNVTMVLNERSGSANKSAVRFSHNASEAKKTMEQEKKLKESASKM